MLLSLLIACRGSDDSQPADSFVETGRETDETDAAPPDDDLGVVCDVASTALPTPPTPVASSAFLPTSNGYSSAWWAIDAKSVPVTYVNGTAARVDQRHGLFGFTDHIAKRPTSDSWARDLLWDAYFGVRVDGVHTWLSDVPELEVGYVPGTGILSVLQEVGPIRVRTYAFVPFYGGGTHDLVMMASVENRDDAPHEVTLSLLHNAHTGGEGPGAAGENVRWGSESQVIVESRGDDHLVHAALGFASHVAAAPPGDDHNPWSRAIAERNLDDVLVSGDDVAVGFQYDFGTLNPHGQRAPEGAILSWGTGDSAATEARAQAFHSQDAGTVLATETFGWSDWHDDDVIPDGLDSDELDLYTQSLAILRMAQVREEGPGKGQILASLPTGIWNMAWPRDMAYATVALAHGGHVPEATDALRFTVNSEAGDYADRLGIDDYMVSACRYTGDGKEESDGASCPDGSDAGPNVELDDFGLFLWSYAETEKRSEDPFFDESRAAVLAGVADPLVELIDPNRDLLVPDSSIWERHWDECFPNGRKRFSYSSIQAVRGLRAAADLSGDDRYSDAAEQLRGGLLRTSVDEGPVVLDGSCPLLASAPEEVCSGCGPFDASVIDAIVQGVIRPDSSLGRGTLFRLQDALAMGNGSPGFLRNDDGSGTTNPYPWYDDQEWVFADLRMAMAYDMAGRASSDPVLRGNATTLFAWVTAVGEVNHGMIPELLSDGRYTGEDDEDRVRPGVDLGAEAQGAVPMAGFGAGLYILTAEQLHAD